MLVGIKDISGYIKHSDKTLQNVYEVDDSSKVDNRCAHVIVEKNSVYFISFKMDTRFRIGVRKYLSAGTLSASYIDPKDDNGFISVNQYVSTTIETGDCTHLFIYYFTASGSQKFLDIKNTIKIYKLESTNIVS